MGGSLRRRLISKQNRVQRSDEKIGAGFVVGHREGPLGRIFFSSLPFEHPTLEAAELHANDLALKFPDRHFFIFSQSAISFVVAPV